jgi:hemin uptake protein HemP
MSETKPNDDLKDDDRDDEQPTRCLPVETLLAGERAVWIEHNGVRYLLRVTRRGRLILTK